MTREEFNDFFNGKLAELADLQQRKGKEYTPIGENRFTQFLRLAPRNRCTPCQQLLSQLSKQMLSVEDIVHGHELTLEDLEHRAGDIIVYLILLMGMRSEGMV